MTIFIGGVVVLILGIIGLIAWRWQFIGVLQGILPIMFIIAGGLAVYLSLDQFKAWFSSKEKGGKNTWDTDGAGVGASPAASTGSDVEALRKENEELKKKLEGQAKTEEKVEEAVKDAAEEVKDVAKEAEDAVKEAATDVEDAAEKIAEDVKDTAKGKK